MKQKFIPIIVFMILCVPAVRAQETEIKLTLNEQFFEALFEAVFKNLDAPSVPISLGAANEEYREPESGIGSSNLDVSQSLLNTHNSAVCDETVRLKREIGGVRTAVRFRDGKIYAPIAFEGNYSPPLIGCIAFSGWAETNVELVFDKTKNALSGNAKVLSVNLTGTNGIGSSIVTRIVQNSIDRKINPIKIIDLAGLSFTAPIQNSGSLRMEATGIRHVVRNKELEVFLKYKFMKADGK